MLLKKAIFFLLICAVAAGSATAQKSDSLNTRQQVVNLDSLTPAADGKDSSVRAKKEGFFKKDYPNPRKAALMSFVLPGSGQIYNKKYWKLPIVYGTLGTLVWVEVNNINQYHELRDNYKWLVDGDDNTNPTEFPYTAMDATTMKAYRDEWKKNVEISSLLLGLAYLLTATDAFVDAHLQRFDVSDDLTIDVKPIEAPGMVPAAGISVGFTLDKVRKTPTRGVVDDFSKP